MSCAGKFEYTSPVELVQKKKNNKIGNNFEVSIKKIEVSVVPQAQEVLNDYMEDGILAKYAFKIT